MDDTVLVKETKEVNFNERCTHHWRCFTEGEGPFRGPLFDGLFYKMDADMPLHEPLRGSFSEGCDTALPER